MMGELCGKEADLEKKAKNISRARLHCERSIHSNRMNPPTIDCINKLTAAHHFSASCPLRSLFPCSSSLRHSASECAHSHGQWRRPKRGGWRDDGCSAWTGRVAEGRRATVQWRGWTGDADRPSLCALVFTAAVRYSSVVSTLCARPLRSSFVAAPLRANSCAQPIALLHTPTPLRAPPSVRPSVRSRLSRTSAMSSSANLQHLMEQAKTIIADLVINVLPTAFPDVQGAEELVSRLAVAVIVAVPLLLRRHRSRVMAAVCSLAVVSLVKLSLSAIAL